MGFLDGNVLWHLCWVLPLFLAVAIYTGYVRKRAMGLFLGMEKAASGAYSTLARGKRKLRLIFLFLTVIFLFTALARFYWGTEKVPYVGSGRDLLVVFDVSKSMLAEDVKPSRLAHGKYLVQELVKANPGDRFGLIAFAGTAFLECPLTLDRVTFSECVKELSTDSIPVGGTNIEEAVRTALQAFKGAESSSCAIILITDGDELQGASSRILEEAKKRGIPLLIAGIGEPSLPGIIRMKNEAGNWVTLRDRSGKAVDSRLNERALKKLAAETNGIYVRSTSADPSFAPLENKIRSLEREKREKGERVRYFELPQYSLVPALFFLLLFFLVGERKGKEKGKKSVSGKAALLFLFLFPFILGGQEKVPLAIPPDDPQVKMPAVSAGQALPGVTSLPAAVPQKGNPYPPPGEGADGVAWYNYGVKLQEANEKSIPANDILEAYRKAYDAGENDPGLRARAMLNTGTVFYRNAERLLMAQAGKNDLQKALRSTKDALQELEKASDAFRQSMLTPIVGDPAAKNQQLLLDFREKIKEYQKKLEELIKQQQKARQDARKALQDQKKENQNKQDKSKQDQKDQQKKKSKQDQKGQQDKQDQPTSQSISQAEKSIDSLEEKARELKQKPLEEQAKKAKEAVKKAEKARNEKKDKEAEKHLEEAVKALGQDEKKQDDSRQDKDNKNDNKDKKDGKKQAKPDPGQAPSGQGDPKHPPRPREEKLDPEQAKKLLELMARDEKTLKEELKERRKRLMRDKTVEKDW